MPLELIPQLYNTASSEGGYFCTEFGKTAYLMDIQLIESSSKILLNIIDLATEVLVNHIDFPVTEAG